MSVGPGRGSVPFSLALLLVLVTGIVAGAGCAARYRAPTSRALAHDPRCLQRVGSDGSDRQLGTACDDHFFAGAGDDTQQGGDGRDVLFGGLGADIQLGESDDDILFGGAGADWQSGGPGDDLLVPGAGGGHVDGGPGIDTLLVDTGDWVYDEAEGGWRDARGGGAIRVEAIERVIDTNGMQIWP